jgi:chaperone required for assembly of F1-ATPase
MTHQKFTGRKRFYKTVDIAPTEDNGFKILLDGRTLKTPGRNPLHLPTVDLAVAIAAEWDAQTDPAKGIQPVTMPLMSIASTVSHRS